MNASVLLQTTGLLVLSNVFMTFAWYAHLRNLSHRGWFVSALVSWGIALFEYLWAALCMMGAVYFIFRAPSGVL